MSKKKNYSILKHSRPATVLGNMHSAFWNICLYCFSNVCVSTSPSGMENNVCLHYFSPFFKRKVSLSRVLWVSLEVGVASMGLPLSKRAQYVVLNLFWLHSVTLSKKMSCNDINVLSLCYIGTTAPNFFLEWNGQFSQDFSHFIQHIF